ncbi:MAG: hypothetical protein MUP69_11515 [Candidatus Atribacteria bacterium]|nr:hypothetical protein [Candidatus Atribacteria bacterium]
MNEKWMWIIGILIAILIFIITEWGEIKKYVPFLPQPLIYITYFVQEKSVLNPENTIITIAFENVGNAPAIYLTALIKSKDAGEWFKFDHKKAEFGISISGISGSVTTITCENILPQQKGFIYLLANNNDFILEEPKVKSNSRYRFLGIAKIKAGQVETYEEYKQKHP